MSTEEKCGTEGETKKNTLNEKKIDTQIRNFKMSFHYLFR